MLKFLSLSALVLGAGLLTGCGERADGHDHDHDHDHAHKVAKAVEKVAKPTIVEFAVGDERFSTLVAAVTKADLVETLSGAGPFTVFAPTNDAFAALPEGTLESLTKEQLIGILTYHVVAGKVPAAEAIKLDGKSAATVNGADINVSVKDGKVMINDATVIIADVMTSNGVIHAIDKVICHQLNNFIVIPHDNYAIT